MFVQNGKHVDSLTMGSSEVVRGRRSSSLFWLVLRSRGRLQRTNATLSCLQFSTRGLLRVAIHALALSQIFALQAVNEWNVVH